MLFSLFLIATCSTLQTSIAATTCGRGEECTAGSEAKDNVLLQLQGALNAKTLLLAQLDSTCLKDTECGSGNECNRPGGHCGSTGSTCLEDIDCEEDCQRPPGQCVAIPLDYTGCYAYTDWGAPVGMDKYNAAENSNTLYLGGARLTGSKSDMQSKCLDECRSRGVYKYFMLHDKTACFCAKQSPTGKKDSSKCSENELWQIEACPNGKYMDSHHPDGPTCMDIPECDENEHWDMSQTMCTGI